jgi:anti-sigma factor RsiW
MKHPADFQLALFAGGDLDVLKRWRVERHLSKCDSCRREVESLRATGDRLRTESVDLPRSLNWDRLAAEMTANIRVGLEAGECVAGSGLKPDRIGWRAAAVMAAMTCMLLAAWWLNPVPKHQPHALRAPHIEMRTTASGIQLNENGNALTLLHTRGRQKPIIVSAPGTLRARFVDNETGQVTINNVYTE